MHAQCYSHFSCLDANTIKLKIVFVKHCMIGQRRVGSMTAKPWEELELVYAVRIDRRLAKGEGRRNTRSGKGVDGVC